MDLDSPSLRLLEYLDRRVSATFANNQERIGQALGLSAEQLGQAIECLQARELVSREMLGESAFILRITDAGITLIKEYRLRQAPRRPWWKCW